MTKKILIVVVVAIVVFTLALWLRKKPNQTQLPSLSNQTNPVTPSTQPIDNVTTLKIEDPLLQTAETKIVKALTEVFGTPNLANYFKNSNNDDKVSGGSFEYSLKRSSTSNDISSLAAALAKQGFKSGGVGEENGVASLNSEDTTYVVGASYTIGETSILVIINNLK